MANFVLADGVETWISLSATFNLFKRTTNAMKQQYYDGLLSKIIYDLHKLIPQALTAHLKYKVRILNEFWFKNCGTIILLSSRILKA